MSPTSLQGFQLLRSTASPKAKVNRRIGIMKCIARQSITSQFANTDTLGKYITGAKRRNITRVYIVLLPSTLPETRGDVRRSTYVDSE